MKSLSTHRITGRGTVKVVPRSEIHTTLRVGDTAEIDGEQWVIAGIESFSVRRSNDNVGLIVRPASNP